jgi:histone deacetylase HOS3
VHGDKGLWLENVIMEPYTSEEHFWKIYEERYKKIIDSARVFLERTSAEKEKTAVFLRCVLLFPVAISSYV